MAARGSVAGEAGAVFAFGAVAGVADVAVEVVGFIAVKAVEGLLAAPGEGAVVAVMGVVAVVHVAEEAGTAVVPGTRSDEETAVEPVRSVVAVGSAVVGGVIEVAVGADGGGTEADTDGNLRGGCSGAA